MSVSFLPSSGYEDNPTIVYQLIGKSSDPLYDTFYIDPHTSKDQTYANVKVNKPLDFERIKEYTLTIRVEVGPDDHTLR